MNTALKVVAALVIAAVFLVTAFAGGVLVGTVVPGDLGQAVGAVSPSTDGVPDAVGEVADIIDDLALKRSSEESMTAGAIRGR